uniref:Rad21/Rec8-like protein C-terminal eukaryotic domain-containing protein n=2 Tax=Takifugu rubripes TaxID=31033 RepID=A0A674N398_TAKRU
MLEQFGRETASPRGPGLTGVASESDLTVSPDSITLRETQPITFPVAEFEGEELVDQHRDTIDFLLAQADQFPEGDLELQVDLEKERKELTGSRLELQDGGLLPPEETGPSAPPREQRTPVSGPTPPSPPSTAKRRKTPAPQGEEGEKARRKRKRQRQLIFFDPVTQVTQGDLQRQISDPQIETRSLLLPPPSSQQRRPAGELLSDPCSFLPEEVQFLWRQAATVTPVSGSNLQIREREPSSESADSERELVGAAAREEDRHELSSKEVPRHMAEPEVFDISDPGSLPLEASDQKEASREISPMYTPERERSPVARSASTLQDIPEVQDELLERAESSGLQLEPGEGEAVSFKSLFPPEVDRRTVSSVFQRLLEYLSSSKLSAQQDAPYGDILISPGPAYDQEVHLI